MEVRIGVTYTAKEIEVELPEGTKADKLQAEIEASITGGGVVWLTDKKGRRVGVPADKVAYIDLGVAGGERRIGFAG